MSKLLNEEYNLIHKLEIIMRNRGSLFGMAIGDALGAAVEFQERGTFPTVTCYRSGGPHSLEKG